MTKPALEEAPVKVHGSRQIRMRCVQRWGMLVRPTNVHLATFATGIALVAALSGCGSNETPSPQASTLNDREISVAKRVVAAELQKAGDDAELTGAVATLSTDRVTQPNTGNSCDSDRLILVQVRGTFPNIVTSGGPPASEGENAADAAVSALLLTADSESELVCLFGVETGDVEPLPGAVDLGVP